MSVVGPRPPLFSEKELIELRTEKGIDALKPGLTGWAQINGRDTLGVIEKVRFDEDYLHNQSLRLDAKIMLITVLKVLRSENILH